MKTNSVGWCPNAALPGVGERLAFVTALPVAALPDELTGIFDERDLLQR